MMNWMKWSIVFTRSIATTQRKETEMTRDDIILSIDEAMSDWSLEELLELYEYIFGEEYDDE